MLSFIGALPGAVSQGLIWGIMAVGVYITYKILDIADLTVDGSFCTGGAVFVVLFGSGANLWLAMLAALAAGLLAGLVTGLLHTACGIPASLAAGSLPPRAGPGNAVRSVLLLHHTRSALSSSASAPAPLTAGPR